MWLISLIVGLIIGISGTYMFCYFLPNEKIKKLNAEVIQEEEAKLKQIDLKKIDLTKQCQELQLEHTKLVERRDAVQENLFEMEKQAAHSADEFLRTKMELAQEQFDRALEQAAAKYQTDEESYRQQYLAALDEYSKEFFKAQQEYQTLAEQLKTDYEKEQQKLQSLQHTVDCAVEAAKNEEAKKQQNNFFRLVLSEADVEEIKKLRAVEPYLRDKEALNKVIWKVYYEKPYTDLVGRVIGNQVKTGIYKITNINNQMCYVGQSVDLASRWKQHIKRGIGAEAPTRNKLYPAMLTFGVENFTFEVIEECEKAQLDEREKFWQEYFQATTFGYSIK